MDGLPQSLQYKSLNSRSLCVWFFILEETNLLLNKWCLIRLSINLGNDNFNQIDPGVNALYSITQGDRFHFPFPEYKCQQGCTTNASDSQMWDQLNIHITSRPFYTSHWQAGISCRWPEDYPGLIDMPDENHSHKYRFPSISWGAWACLKWMDQSKIKESKVGLLFACWPWIGGHIGWF